MIKAIQQDSKLGNFIHYDFEDSGVKVNVCSSLSKNDFIGVKIDDYYNSTQPGTAPKSIDFIVSVDCSCGSYGLYLLELKSYKKPKYLSIKEIYEKFDTTVNDFVKKQFQSISKIQSININLSIYIWSRMFIKRQPKRENIYLKIH